MSVFRPKSGPTLYTRYVGSDLGPRGLPMLSTDDTNKVHVSMYVIPPTANISSFGDGFKSHRTDWRSPGLNFDPWFISRLAYRLHHGGS